MLPGKERRDAATRRTEHLAHRCLIIVPCVHSHLTLSYAGLLCRDLQELGLRQYDVHVRDYVLVERYWEVSEEAAERVGVPPHERSGREEGGEEEGDGVL